MPPGTLGFRATGEITREDYADVLVSELHSALWTDSKLGFDLAVRHHDQWERSAIVTDIAWMAQATKLFAWMIPGEARVFPRTELDQAKAWVAGAGT